MNELHRLSETPQMALNRQQILENFIRNVAIPDEARGVATRGTVDALNLGQRADANANRQAVTRVGMGTNPMTYRNYLTDLMRQAVIEPGIRNAVRRVDDYFTPPMQILSGKGSIPIN